MTPDSLVQTAQEILSGPDPAPDTARGAAVCLRYPKGQRLVVVANISLAPIRFPGWVRDDSVILRGACACGCGLPVPSEYDGAIGGYVSLQKYADPEGCRKALYALMHPALDLSGMLPEKAKQAARMAEEAVKAAKLGQLRATVDARSEIEHAALRPDPRPSCRLRVTPRHFEMLEEMKQLDGLYSDWAYSKIVMDLIEREVEDCRLRARQEGEHDG